MGKDQWANMTFSDRDLTHSQMQRTTDDYFANVCRHVQMFLKFLPMNLLFCHGRVAFFRLREFPLILIARTWCQRLRTKGILYWLYKFNINSSQTNLTLVYIHSGTTAHWRSPTLTDTHTVRTMQHTSAHANLLKHWHTFLDAGSMSTNVHMYTEMLINEHVHSM